MDSRDLNYNKYFVEGEKMVSEFEDYTSHNTERLSVSRIKELLINLNFVKDALNA